MQIQFLASIIKYAERGKGTGFCSPGFQLSYIQGLDVKVITVTNDGAELLWITKKQKLCIVTNPSTSAPNNPEVSVTYFLHSVKDSNFCECAMPHKYLV